MGFFSGLFSSTKKRRARYTKEALSKFNRIVAKYELPMQENEYKYIAQAIGDAKAKAAKKSFFGGFLGAVFSIVGGIFTGGILGFASASLGVLSSKKLASNALKSSNLAFKTSNTFKKAAWLKNINETQKDKQELISDKTYPIYADGSIYKLHAAGSQTYSPSIAYDTTKGLNENIQYEKIDEMIQTRSHYTLAGNEGYMYEISEGFIEGLQKEFDTEEKINAFANEAFLKTQKIKKAFSELVQAGFDYKNTALKHYEEVIKRQIHPILRKIISLDFLEKNKNYNKALRLELPLNLNDLIEKKLLSEEEKDKQITQKKEFKNIIETKMQKWKEKRLKEIQKEEQAWQKILNIQWGPIFKKEQRAKYEAWKQKTQNDFLAEEKALKSRLEKELLAEEKRLLEDEFYIQKSKLTSIEAKKRDYLEKVEFKVSLFLAKVSRLYHFLSTEENNAMLLNESFFYNDNPAWLEENVKSIDEIFNHIYVNKTDLSEEQAKIHFYENYILKHFTSVQVRSENFKAFWIRLEGKLWLKIVKTDLSEVLSPIFKGF